MPRRLLLAISAVLLLSSTAFARSAPSIARQASAFPAPPVRARAAAVMDVATGAILMAKNLHLRLPMASTTKIMTALVALQHGQLSDRITVPSAAFNFESDATVMGLHPGQVVTLRDLLYGLLLPSGADAANTIAIHYGGSEAGFVAMMNRTAATLGMHDTHYNNAHGLTSPNHYTSAYDLALLAQYVSGIPALMKIVSTRTHLWNKHVLTNLNRVLFWYPGVDGIKPGYTDDAGICQVLDVKRDSRHILVVLLNTPDLVIDARNLLNFGLRDYTWASSSPTDAPTLSLSGSDASGSYVYFPASGHYVRGKFWKTFTSDGGPATLGFPRTEVLQTGTTQTQYFQNAALSLQPSTGKISRLALGLTVAPTATPRPTVTSTAVRTPTPYEGSVGGSRTPSPTTVARTPTVKPKLTATPRTQPPATPTTVVAPSTAAVFAHFHQSHSLLLGAAAGKATQQNGYTWQIFAYGGLVYDAHTHAVYLLPLADRILSARHYLPAHPGNSYPITFAPMSILKAIAWPPYN
ncbi:MAG TPA: serine hydrolase [Chloroflexota bacterium]